MNDANDAARRALAVAGVLGAGLAHELRNTLASASSALFLAKRDKGDPARLSRHLDRADDEVRKSQDLIDRVLGLARGERLRRERVAVRQIVEGALASMGEARARVSVALTPPDLEVLCESLLLERVLENLLRNADEALGDKPSGRIELRVSTVDTSARFEVTDNGPGIDAALASRLFEPLVTSKASGTGLGLALCRVLVEAHGGSIEARAAAGGGAVFSFVLPNDD